MRAQISTRSVNNREKSNLHKRIRSSHLVSDPWKIESKKKNISFQHFKKTFNILKYPLLVFDGEELTHWLILNFNDLSFFFFNRRGSLIFVHDVPESRLEDCSTYRNRRMESRRGKFGFVSQVKCWFTWLEEIEAALDARITNLDRVWRLGNSISLEL